jgi:DNA primase
MDIKYRLVQANKIALKYFIASFHKSKKAKKSAYSRLSKEIVEKFLIGYAPPTGLIDVFNLKKVKAKDAYKVGLVGKNIEDGTYYEVFRDRLIFPLIQNNILIGFSGRTLNNNKSKYINSKSSPLYNKSETLYCLDPSKKNIHKTKKCFLVEGQFDVLGLFQSNIKNVVASCGTAFKKEHARLIKRWANIVYICFDGDTAGKLAAKKAKRIIKNEKMEVHIINLPNIHDAFSYIKEKGNKKFLTLNNL